MPEDNLFDMNYWLEETAKIDDIVESNLDLILLMHNSAEFEDLFDFMGRLPSDRIVYISMTKTYDSISQQIKKMKKTVYVVDCVSQSLFVKESTADCLYVKPLQSLRETIGLVKSVLKGGHGEYVIIDAISQFIDFSNPRDEMESIVPYSKQLKDVLWETASKAVLLYDDHSTKETKNLPKAFVSKIIKLEVFKDRVYWG